MINDRTISIVRDAEISRRRRERGARAAPAAGETRRRRRLAARRAHAAAAIRRRSPVRRRNHRHRGEARGIPAAQRAGGDRARLARARTPADHRPQERDHADPEPADRHQLDAGRLRSGAARHRFDQPHRVRRCRRRVPRRRLLLAAAAGRDHADLRPRPARGAARPAGHACSAAMRTPASSTWSPRSRSSMRPSAQLDLTLGSYDLTRLKGHVNVPLVGHLRAARRGLRRASATATPRFLPGSNVQRVDLALRRQRQARVPPLGPVGARRGVARVRLRRALCRPRRGHDPGEPDARRGHGLALRADHLARRARHEERHVPPAHRLPAGRRSSSATCSAGRA